MNEKRLNERETSGLEPTLNTSQAVQLIFDLLLGLSTLSDTLAHKSLEIEICSPCKKWLLVRGTHLFA